MEPAEEDLKCQININIHELQKQSVQPRGNTDKTCTVVKVNCQLITHFRCNQHQTQQPELIWFIVWSVSWTVLQH